MQMQFKLDMPRVVLILGLASLGVGLCVWFIRRGDMHAEVLAVPVAYWVGRAHEAAKWALPKYFTDPRLNAAARSVAPPPPRAPEPSLHDLAEEIRKDGAR